MSQSTFLQLLRRKGLRIAAGLMGVLLPLSSCGSSSPTSAPAPTALPTPVPYEGIWDGPPDRWGHPVITFTVAGQQVTALEYRLAYVQVLTSRGSIQLRWNSLTLKAVGPLTISGATFSGRIEYWAYGILYGGTTVRGTFSSNTTSEGTIESLTLAPAANPSEPSVAAKTWTATKR